MSGILEKVAGKLLVLIAEDAGEKGTAGRGVTLKRLDERSKTPPSKDKWAAVTELSQAGYVAILSPEPGKERVRLTEAGLSALLAEARFGASYKFTGKMVNDLVALFRAHAVVAPASASAPAPASASAPAPEPAPSPPIAAAPPPPESEVKSRILRAIADLEPVESRLVPIFRVRAAASDGAPREAFDEAVRGLEREGKVWLSKITDPRGVTDAQRRDSLFGRLTGDLLYYVSLRRD